MSTDDLLRNMSDHHVLFQAELDRVRLILDGMTPSDFKDELERFHQEVANIVSAMKSDLNRA
jgi:hypothetical protein